MRTLVVFSHGKESGPWGDKIRCLAEIAQRRGAMILSPDYAGCRTAEERVAMLLRLSLPPHERLILAGSSMGGYVATHASQSLLPDGLFLLAPAFYPPVYAVHAPVPHARHVSIVHGWNDDVVDPGSSMQFARQHGCTLHFIPGDHRLTSSLAAIKPLFCDFMGRCFDVEVAPDALGKIPHATSD